MHRQLAATCLLLFWAGALHAQQYAGTYTAVNAAGKTVTLVLAQDAQGQVTGSIATDAMQAQISGSPEDEAIVGIVSAQGEAMYFEAEFDDGVLYLVLVPADQQGNPNYDAAQELEFSPAGAGASARAGAAAQPANPMAQPTHPMVRPADPGGAGDGLSDGTALGNEWVGFLSGKKVTYMDSYSSGSAGGYSTRVDVFLCSSGEFLHKGQDLVSVDVPGASGYSGENAANTGRWRIITQGQVAGIELRFNDGRTEQFRLDYQNGQTYANGDRVYVTPAEICP